MHKVAPSGYTYCVSYYWLNASSLDISRFWTQEFNETDAVYSFASAIVPRTFLRDGELFVKAQYINPEDIDKRVQGVYMFKVPKQIWMNGEVKVLDSALTLAPSAELSELSKKLLGCLTL